MSTPNQSPIITHVLVVPGLSPSFEPSQPNNQTILQPEETVSIGLVLDETHVVWGDCVVAGGDITGQLPRLALAESLTPIQDRVIPALQGQSLSNFRALVAQVDELTEPVTITEIIPHLEQDRESDKISRRDLFTGRLWAADKPKDTLPRTKQVKIERPFHPAIRYGVSEALLAAVAMSRGLTVAEVIAEEYDLSLPASPVPIHAEMGSDKAAVDPLLGFHCASLGVTLPGKKPAVELGNNGENLQRYATELSQYISQAADYHPAIHLDVRGGLGALCNDNVGKILGILFGLKSVAAAHPVRIADPMIMNGRQAQIEKMRQLKDYLRFRKVPLQLVANAWIHSLDDVQAFVQAEAVDMIHLHALWLGSLHQTIEAVLYCRKQGVGVLLDVGRYGRFIPQIALATQPDFVAGPPADLHNEMARTLAWLSHAHD
ncbi:MAG: hypothetical protein GY943_12460 [Chloroflexi bacterium]|nr:hypothetical protein [Chloroflexota bacterium]